MSAVRVPKSHLRELFLLYEKEKMSEAESGPETKMGVAGNHGPLGWYAISDVDLLAAKQKHFAECRQCQAEAIIRFGWFLLL